MARVGHSVLPSARVIVGEKGRLGRYHRAQEVRVTMLDRSQISAVFEATVQATEEAIINALIAAETMVGIDGRVIRALPQDRLQQVLQKYNRWMG